jgi:hypothetical protein
MLQVPQLTCLPFVQPLVRLHERVLQCIVVYYEKELRAPIKVVTPLMPINRLANGQRF